MVSHFAPFFEFLNYCYRSRANWSWVISGGPVIKYISVLLEVLTVTGELGCEWKVEAGLIYILSFIFAPVGGDILQNILIAYLYYLILDVKEFLSHSFVNYSAEVVIYPIR